LVEATGKGGHGGHGKGRKGKKGAKGGYPPMQGYGAKIPPAPVKPQAPAYQAPSKPITPKYAVPKAPKYQPPPPSPVPYKPPVKNSCVPPSPSPSSYPSTTFYPVTNYLPTTTYAATSAAYQTPMPTIYPTMAPFSAQTYSYQATTTTYLAPSPPPMNTDGTAYFNSNSTNSSSVVPADSIDQLSIYPSQGNILSTMTQTMYFTIFMFTFLIF
jgi:hypothetical protein